MLEPTGTAQPDETNTGGRWWNLAGLGRREGVALAALTLLAAILRLWRLGDLPPGLHVDEAFNMLDARAVLAGWHPAFLPANAGREVLYTYWQALLFGLFGESVVSARLASALVGLLAIPATWAFVRRLPLARAERVALLTAGLTAVSYWHLHFSRFGIRAVAFPLVVTGVMWAWWGLVRPRPSAPSGGGDSGLAGLRDVVVLAVLLGLAVYTHPVGRALAVVPAVHAAYRWLRWRDTRPARVLAAALVGALVVALPAVLFWFEHPWLFTGHAQETSILGAGPAVVAANLAKVLGMFNVAGDPAPWRNLAGRPVFDLPTGILFLVGFANTVYAARRGSEASALILSWSGVLLLPTVFTDAAPNFSRAIGVIPVVFLFPAMALDRLAEAVSQQWGRTLAVAVVVGWLGLSGAWTAYGYFAEWADGPDTPLAFDDDKVALGEYVGERTRNGVGVYLSRRMADHPTVRVAADVPVRGFDPGRGLVLPPEDVGALEDVSAAEYVFLPQEQDAIAWLRERVVTYALGNVGQAQSMTVVASTTHGRYDLAVYRLSEPYFRGSAGGWPSGGTFGERVFTMGAMAPYDRLVHIRPATTITIPLGWGALGPTSTDLNVAVHIVGPDGLTIAQGDGPPLGGSYPTTVWRTGEMIIDLREVRIPDDLPAGRAAIRVGLYDWRTGEPLTTAEGESLVTVGKVQIDP